MTPTHSDTWRIALHESGHAVAARALGAGGWGTIAVLLPGIGGFATRHHAMPRDVAIIAAAGPAAEPLAEKHTPPSDVVTDDAEPRGGNDSARFPFDAQPELTAGFEAALADAISDDATVAAYVYFPRLDGLWLSRLGITHNVAREIVRRFEPTIVAIARELYRRRVLTPTVLNELLRPIPQGADIGADLIERNIDMLDNLVDQIDQSEATAKQAFIDLVRDVAAGVSPDPATAAATLRAAGKTTGDLRDAVARWAERLRLNDLACSAAQGLNDERATLREKIQRADAELERARLKHLEAVMPLARRIREIDAVESRADDARLALIRTCTDERRGAYDDAAHRHALADARVSELKRLVMRGQHRDRADRGPDAERERACGRTAAAALPEAEREAARLLIERDRAEAECAKP